MKVYGPIEQSSFLREMGIDMRMIRLLSRAQNDDQKVEQLVTSYTRLMDDMGQSYKVLALASADSGPAAGFS